ncbi:MAG: phosphoglycolate phosphatase [Gammaproteobacteria bacterium]
MTGRARLLLFDLDGTLVDSAPDIAIAVDAALAAQGRPSIGLEAVRGYIGNGASRLIHRALTGTRDGDAEPAVFDAVYASFLELYQARLFVDSQVYPGVETVLRTMVDAGWTLGVVTNKPERFTRPLLEAAGLAGSFAVVLSGDSLPRKKPDPMPLVHAAAEVGAALAQTVLIGDSVTDIEAARLAGVAAICVSYGYAGGIDLTALIDVRIIDEMQELPAVIAEIGRSQRFVPDSTGVDIK